MILAWQIGKLSEEQVERLSGLAMEYLDQNTELENTAPPFGYFSAGRAQRGRVASAACPALVPL